MANPEVEKLVLEVGEKLFDQGDPGGDLFIIEEGEVTIFTKGEGDEVTLTSMKAGEVIGLLSVMTQEPRLASAKAATAVIIKRVQQENVAKLIRELPAWMKTVLREFHLRLGHMNRAYSEAVSLNKQLRQREISRLYTGSQLAASMAACLDYHKIVVEGAAAVLTDPLLDLMAEMILRPRRELEEIFKIFGELGLIRLKVEPTKRRKYMLLDDAIKLKAFADFVRHAKRLPNRLLVQASFSSKDQRVLNAILRYAEAMKLKLDAPVHLLLKELETSLKSVAKEEFKIDPVLKASAFGLLKLEGEDSQQKVSLTPLELEATLAHIAVYRRLAKTSDEIAVTGKN